MKKIELILQGGTAEATILETFRWEGYNLAITKRVVNMDDGTTKALYEAVLLDSARPLRNSFEKTMLKELTIRSLDEATHKDKMKEAFDKDIAQYPLIRQGIEWAEEQEPAILRGAVLAARDKGIFN